MKTNTVLFLLIATFLYPFSFAQAQKLPQRAAGGSEDDNFSKLILTQDGGVLAGGTSSSGISGDKTEPSRGSTDYWVVKYDKTGKTQWNKTIGSSGEEHLAGMVQTADGGYLLGGASFGDVSGDKTSPRIGNQSFGEYWIVKLDANGNKLWDKTFATDYDDFYGYYQFWLSSLQETSDKGFILAGILSSDETYYFPYYVVKADSLGNTQWTKTYSSMVSSPVIQQTPDGGYLLAGNDIDRNQEVQNYQLVRIDKNGNQLWSKDYAARTSAYLRALVQTGSSYVLGGYTASGKGGVKTEPNRGPKNTNDYWLVTVDTAGNVLSDKTVGGKGDENLSSLIKTADGGLLLDGFSNSDSSGEKTENGRGGYDYWMVKLNRAGKQLWDKTYGGSADDKPGNALEKGTDEFVLGGTSLSGISGDKTVPSKGKADFWLVATKYVATAAVVTKAVPDFTVYPNPARERINVMAKEKAQFSLTNQQGRVIAVKTIAGSGSFEAGQLIPGNYFITNLATGAKLTAVVVR